MKKIDKLLISSFVGPFIVTFFIAIFVLMMQTLWLYIDDIAGKGASLFMILEFLAYLSVSLIPMALPIAVLISSVMVLGNLAEHYELSSFKSAGVSLWRVMMPLMFIAMGISVASFFCNNNLIPISNLKFKSRLYDMRKQKPTLSLEEGVFNDDFQGFAIRIGSKDENERTINDILMYDHSEATKGRLTEVLAETGEMYPTPDEQYFVMELHNGHQYSETKPSNTGKKKSYPFVRTNFKEWHKIFDLSEFEIESTDEQLFKSHQSMLSSRQLTIAIDSIDNKIEDRYQSLADGASNFFHFEQKALRERRKQEVLEQAKAEDKEEIKQKLNIKKETLKEKKQQEQKTKDKKDKQLKNNDLVKIKQNSLSKVKSTNKRRKSTGRTPLEQKIDKPLAEYNSILELFPEKEHKRLEDKAKASARSIKNQSESANRTIVRISESRVKHIHTLHNKFSMALACFIFLFIGAPMGAIIRKGGFGYPILISIIFFMLFVIMTIASKKMAESFVMDPVLAAWLPCLVLFPIGLILTYKAMTDSKLLNFDKYFALFKKIGKKKPVSVKTG